MPTNTELAWAAGFFDGEGCIHAHTDTRPGRGRRDTYYQLMVSVGQVHREPLEQLMAWFGGSIRKSREYVGNRWGNKYNTIFWQWNLSGIKSVEFLEAIAPFSRVKKSQVDIALQWPIQPVKFTAINDDDYNLQATICNGLQQIKQANLNNSLQP